jgi:hypothetical protein
MLQERLFLKSYKYQEIVHIYLQDNLFGVVDIVFTSNVTLVSNITFIVIFFLSIIICVLFLDIYNFLKKVFPATFFERV